MVASGFHLCSMAGIQRNVVKISENGDVTAICVGTGIMPSTVFYYNRPTQEMIRWVKGLCYVLWWK